MDNIEGSIKNKPALHGDSVQVTDSSVKNSHAGDADDDQPTRIKPPREPQSKTEPMRSHEAISIGSILKGRFIIEKEIARGGMGVVYRARDFLKEQFQDRNPYIAIKVLGEECKAHPDFLMALQREAVKAQKLAHPNIVIVHDFDADGTNVFMTMEYLEGETLQALLARRKKIGLPANEALALIKQMGQGLDYAHQKGIVHCDFKPGNVFLTNDRTVKILDFGIARATSRPEQMQLDTTRFDAATLDALTPTYASCELLEKATPDPRDDIYSLACVSYQLLTGRHPFNRVPANTARDSNLKPAPIKELNKQQWTTIARGLAFERDARPANVMEFLSGLSATPKPTGNTVLRTLLAGLGIIGLLIAGLIVIEPRLNNQTPAASSPPIAVPSTTAPSTVAPTITSTPLTDEQQKTVARLLEAAEIHFMVKRVTEPVGSNAYEAYLHVLEIDPNNQQAKTGLQQIADYYQTLAKESLTNGDQKQALSYIKTGLTASPQHAGLNQLKQQLENKSMFSQAADWLKSLAE